ncbi:hypothetical protein DPMN_105401 [Dreissena polymorpha]|uniref:Uncharacterized protein n=1 Tax=Dreissena polymorpha TaxID=45954 RepID=A0A9D4HEP7_DREPO|nr:hypothetical protein DPMN_105401 [Dreissena polymorpha]
MNVRSSASVSGRVGRHGVNIRQAVATVSPAVLLSKASVLRVCTQVGVESGSFRPKSRSPPSRFAPRVVSPWVVSP